MTRHDSNKETGDSSDKGSKPSDNAAKETAGSLENQKSAATMVKDARKQLEGKHVVTQPGQEGFQLTGDGKPQTKQAPGDGKGDKSATPSSGPSSGPAFEQAEAAPEEPKILKMRQEADKLNILTNQFDAIDKAGRENGKITERDINKYIKENAGKLSDEELGALNYAKERMAELQDKSDDKGWDRGFSKADLTTEKSERNKERKEVGQAEMAKGIDAFADAMEQGKKTGNYAEAIKQYNLVNGAYGNTVGFAKAMNQELHDRGVLPKSMTIDSNPVDYDRIFPNVLPIKNSDGVRDQFDSKGKAVDKPELEGKNLNEVIEKQIVAEKKVDAEIEKDVKAAAKAFADGDYKAVVKDFQAASKDYNNVETKQYIALLNKQLHDQGILPSTVEIDSAYLNFDKNEPGIPLKDTGNKWYAVYDSSGNDITKPGTEDYPIPRDGAPKKLQDAIYTAKEVKENKNREFIDPFATPGKKK